MTLDPPKIYIIHENDEWLAPLATRLDDAGLPHVAWHLGEGASALDGTGLRPPPIGVFFSRLSASAHTRGNAFAPAQAAPLLEWLEGAGRTVFNGSRAVDLGISKARQYVALTRAGVSVPPWRAAATPSAVRDAARAIGFPLIIKPNCGGKGLGVTQFLTTDGLEQALTADQIGWGPDHVVIVQTAVESDEGAIVRSEFVDGQLVYAVRVDTSDGGFELCPADACTVDDTFCPVGTDSATPRFEILNGFQPPDIERYQCFLSQNRLAVSGIEMITDREGKAWTYDVNTNTNYNIAAEQAAGVAGTAGSGHGALVRMLGKALARQAAAPRTAA